MQVFPLFYNPIPEECDLIRVYVDPQVAQEQCSFMNKTFNEINSYSFTKFPYIVGSAVDVVE